MSSAFFRPLWVSIVIVFLAVLIGSCTTASVTKKDVSGRAYNGPYIGENLNRIAFPIGGIGAGMFCLEGTGARLENLRGPPNRKRIGRDNLWISPVQGRVLPGQVPFRDRDTP